MPADKLKIAALENMLNESAEGLPNVSSKKLFGCHALFANGNVFGLVWKHGQIGVKLTKEADYEKLISAKGAGPWKAGPMKMAHWVLVPESLQKDRAKLRPWIERAHEQALSLPPKEKAKTKKKASGTRRKWPNGL